jgi:putative flippase GtrA
MYLIFGALTTFISLITYYILTVTILTVNNNLELQTANLISWVVGILFAYFTSSKYVFQSKNNWKGKEFISFIFSRITTLLLDMLIMYLGVSILKFNSVAVKIISQVLVIILNYILSKIIVFNSKI